MIFFKNKRKDKNLKNNDPIREKDTSHIIESDLLLTEETELDVAEINIEPIELEILPEDFKIDNYHAHEIKDLSLISRLNGLMQGGAQQVLQKSQTKLIFKIFKDTETLLKSDIPIGDLTKAKGTQNGYRAILMEKKRIKKNAILTHVDTSKIVKSTNKTAKVMGVMNIASLIVGQYYMKEISSKLSSIATDLNSIKSVQEIEFKSRIKSLGDNIIHLIKFNSETLEIPELRRTAIEQLNRFKNENIMLLNQVNITIQDIVDKSKITKIKDYELKVQDLETQFKYQMGLSSSLEEISKLIYLVNLGEVSLESSIDQHKLLTEESNNVRNSVKVWHNNNTNNLKIDLNNDRYKKGGLEGLLVKPLSLLFNDKWTYKKLNPSIKNMINLQKGESFSELNNLENIFEDDVMLIYKDDKYYYLPN